MDFPTQESSSPRWRHTPSAGRFDMRDGLTPRRLTLAMWDQAFLLRHIPGGSYEDTDRVLDEAIERGYNTLRLDPLPQLLDLAQPEKVFTWDDPKTPYMPWCWDTAVAGPVGLWLIEFMEKLLRRPLGYTLSAWWFHGGSGNNPFPQAAAAPRTHVEAAELWITMLHEWKRRFGFAGLTYVDLANEVPYFLPGFMDRFREETGEPWGGSPRFSARQIEFLAKELNDAFALLRREFPELRFTASIHGDERWLDVPVDFDCLDVHFYADADRRWSQRTRFGEHMSHLFTDASWHREFSDRCAMTHAAVAPMLRARQHAKLASFAAWSSRFGMPLTTSESWASWYYFDSPELDWGWLLEWAEWSVEDAIEFGMWGWTPHNYVQPQFANWRDVRWHRRLTERFLRS
jgi:hypothetical protein